MNIPDSMATAFISLIAAGAGAFFGAYFKKKGENLATREDVEAITRKQEEIKDLISNRSWDRQRQWEMKHSALVTALQAAWDCNDSIIHFAGYREWAKSQGQPTDESLLKTKELDQAMSSAVTACIRADILVKLICEIKTVDAFAALRVNLGQTASQVRHADFIELKRDTMSHLRSLIDLTLATAREELRVQSETLPPPVA